MGPGSEMGLSLCQVWDRDESTACVGPEDHDSVSICVTSSSWETPQSQTNRNGWSLAPRSMTPSVFFFFFFLATLLGLRDLSSPTRD